ncbi:MAG: hypothetical protein M3Q07_23050, partial [Pseudobdellovibrionaceae bacterium]|nr:hypothetical protein [Pseudobdellovibrionaceae bacterium]
MLALITLCVLMLAVKEHVTLEVLPTQQEFDWQIEDDPWTVYEWTSKALESIGPETPTAQKMRIVNYFMRSVAETMIFDLADKHIELIETYWKNDAEQSLKSDQLAIGYSLGAYYV